MKCGFGSALWVLSFVNNMATGITQVLRSRGFAWSVHGGLWLLLYLAVANLGGKAPVFHEGQGSSTAPQIITPVAKLDLLFSPAGVVQSVSATNLPNPFFTTHFVPPAPVAPPPPTTRNLDVVYQGYYQTEAGPKFAVISLAGGLKVTKIGALLATNWFVADANLQTVLLTNTSGQTNLLNLNTNKQIEVPVR